jgi:hypothetical protein
MDDEIKFAAFKLGLETKMEAPNSSCKEVCSDRPNVPATKTRAGLHLKDDLPWEFEIKDKAMF